MGNNTKYHGLIEAKRLSLSSPEYVYDWLEKHADELILTHTHDNVPLEIFKTLYNCNSDLINLGLASFCNNDEILRRLFIDASNTDNEAQRCAVLSNRHCVFSAGRLGTFNTDELKNILEKATDAEMHHSPVSGLLI
jgi:hypothetical protein